MKHKEKSLQNAQLTVKAHLFEELFVDTWIEHSISDKYILCHDLFEDAIAEFYYNPCQDMFVITNSLFKLTEDEKDMIWDKFKDTDFYKCYEIEDTYNDNQGIFNQQY